MSSGLVGFSVLGWDWTLLSSFSLHVNIVNEACLLFKPVTGSAVVCLMATAGIYC